MWPDGQFARAARDYRWLLDAGYPERASITLVGDRYRLSAGDRTALYRGVSSAEDSLRRSAAVRSGGFEARLLIDGYNQIFTIAHYLEGRRVFVSTDGVVRDSAGARGRVHCRGAFARAIEALAEAAAARIGGEASRGFPVELHFDSPVPRSAEHAEAARAAFASCGFAAESFVERSADYPLKRARGAAVASGDSAVIDAVAREARGEGRGEPCVVDLAREAIARFPGGRELADLSALMGVAPTRR